LDCTYDVSSVVGVDLLDIGVDEILSIRSGDDNLSLALDGGGGEEDVLDEGEDAVAFGLLGEALGLADLLSDEIRGVEQVDLGLLVAGGHLGAVETGDHGGDEVSALQEVNENLFGRLGEEKGIRTTL
jgi:hypothetical protein